MSPTRRRPEHSLRSFRAWTSQSCAPAWESRVRQRQLRLIVVVDGAVGKGEQLGRGLRRRFRRGFRSGFRRRLGRGHRCRLHKRGRKMKQRLADPVGAAGRQEDHDEQSQYDQCDFGRSSQNSILFCLFFSILAPPRRQCKKDSIAAPYDIR